MFNIQNLGRTGVGAEVRELLRPHAGRAFVIGDLAQIEARVTAWLAGENGLLNAFSNRADIYSDFINRALGWNTHKPSAADPPETHAELNTRRQVGKQAVLGLGFGMGALKFMNTLNQDPMAAKLLADGTLTPQACVQIKDAFRSQYSAIKLLWDHLEEAFRKAMVGVTTQVGGVEFSGIGNVVKVKLPSSRVLKYAEPRLDHTPRIIRHLDASGNEAEFTTNRPSIPYGNGIGLYGGKLTENLAQAIARASLVHP